MMQWTVRLEATTSAGEVTTTELVTFSRPAMVSTLAEVGLVLDESKALLAKLQASMLCGQVAEHAGHHRAYAACGALQPLKDRRTRRLQTLFGTVEVEAPRFKLCRCRQPAPMPYAPRADLNETERLATSCGMRFMPIVADIRDVAALRSAAAQVAERMGQVHIVVANAGIQLFKPLLDMNDAEWHDIVDVNLNGTANTIRAFGPALVTGGGGRIIVVSSMQGRYGTKNGASYSASKWGIFGLMKSAALELGVHKVTVNAVVPGLIDTPMTRNEMRWKQGIKATTGQVVADPTEAQAITSLKPHSPLGVPWLNPDQIAPAAVFLASDAAAMVSGAAYEVNGGDSAHDSA